MYKGDEFIIGGGFVPFDDFCIMFDGICGGVYSVLVAVPGMDTVAEYRGGVGVVVVASWGVLYGVVQG